MIIDQMRKELKEARKAKDKKLTGTLTALVGEVQMVGKNKGNRETNDAETLVVVTKFVKNLKELIQVMKDNNLSIENENIELKVYEGYLPEQMSKEELEVKIGLYLQTESDPNMGKIMSHLKKE